MRKKIIALFLAMLMLTTLAVACDNDPENTASENSTGEDVSSNQNTSEETSNTNEELDIVWVHSGAANQSEQRAYAGFTAYLEDQGWDWSVSEVNSEDSGDKVARNISDAVAKGCDVIIASMAEMRASAASIKEATDANIPIFTIDSGYTDGVVVDVTSTL